jgi:hypothetical protein
MGSQEELRPAAGIPSTISMLSPASHKDHPELSFASSMEQNHRFPTLDHPGIRQRRFRCRWTRRRR